VEDALRVFRAEALSQQRAQHLRPDQLIDEEIGIDAVRQLAGGDGLLDNGATFGAAGQKDILIEALA
jgi:hypothetical protein